MEQELTQLVRGQINAYYEEIKKLLLCSSSYEGDLETDNVALYFSFLEKALAQNYHRIMHLYFFICEDSTMSEVMFPFCQLKGMAKRRLEGRYCLSVWIMEGFEKLE